MKYQKYPIFTYFLGFLSFLALEPDLASYGHFSGPFWPKMPRKWPKNDQFSHSQVWHIKTGLFLPLNNLPRGRSHVVGCELPKCPVGPADELRPWSLQGYYCNMAAHPTRRLLATSQMPPFWDINPLGLSASKIWMCYNFMQWELHR